MGPVDANTSGNVHGGVILRLVDEVAGIAAVRHCGLQVVTAALDRMTFLHPVFIGDLVTLRASVNAAWTTSMEVGVRVEAEKVPTRAITHTSTAYLTFVALDEEGRPAEVAPLRPETPEELRRGREAQLRRDNRLGERRSIEAGRADGASRGGGRAARPGAPA